METLYKKFGIRVDPPAFIVIYCIGDKLKKKSMPLRNFKSFSDVEFVAKDLTRRHKLERIPVVKIEKMLRLLQERLKGLGEIEALEKVENEYKLKINEDLNKLSTQELEVQKKLMDSLFLKNQVRREDQEFEYDKKVDFLGQKEKSDWDNDSDNFWD